MRPGDLIDERFVIDAHVRSGGMGAIYRAHDRARGDVVALKVLVDRGESIRFDREVALLRTISHPAIVQYVAHGTATTGEPYLAMEWLEGETLADRLARAEPTLGEAIALARRIAEALAVVHARGVVHRDIKPSNVFLVGSRMEDAKIIDFGIAWPGRAASPITRTGALVGTPGYLAPEQARGGGTIDARADVFCVGCVLFRCVTGRDVFAGVDVFAVLMKTVLEHAPRVSSLRPDVPAALDELVSRMLSKSPSERPRDGAELAEAIRLVEEKLASEPSLHVPSAIPAVTAKERRVRCMVLARPSVAAPDRAITMDTTAVDSREGALRQAVERFGGELDLAGGAVIVTMSSTGAATDQAVCAARCALALRDVLGDVSLAAVATRSESPRPAALGDVIDRAAALLATDRAAIHVDDVIAGLLDDRFDVRCDQAGFWLRGERTSTDATRTLLGRQTECVGREREIEFLLATLEQSIRGPSAQAVVLTGPPGVGKSRVCYELLRKLSNAPERAQIWRGRADPMRTGAPFGMIASAVRTMAGIAGTEPRALQRRRLRARLGRSFAGADLARLEEFLGEMIAAPADERPSVHLRMARSDAVLMGDQIRGAWEDLVAAECATQPLLLVLEDLHWGDLPSVKLIDAALRLRDLPLMVLAVARPEVHETFPGLWHGRKVHELRLDELPRTASEELVRAVLGDGVAPEIVSQIVERAGGNAFYLEELIRAVAEGRTELPGTVLAMAETRLEQLEGEARRIVRAASVFGQTFWLAGVAHLLGSSAPAAAIGEWIEQLVDREVVSRQRASRFPGEVELRFRHALVREAAYAMLTEGDRALAHRLAGQWLERTAEPDASVLAEHYERGGDSEHALTAYHRAAQQALDGNDFPAAAERAARAIACGATGEARGALYVLEAEALYFQGNLAATERAALGAMELLPRGAPWYSAARWGVTACARLGHRDRLLEIAAQIVDGGRPSAEDGDEDEESVAAKAIACARAAESLLLAGRRDVAESLLDHIDRLQRRLADHPMALAHVWQVRALLALLAGEPSTCLRMAEAALESSLRAGNVRRACVARGNIGYAYLLMGAYELAEESLRSALDSAERLGFNLAVVTAKNNLALSLGRRDRIVEGIAVAEDGVAQAIAIGDPTLVCASQMYLALLLQTAGRLGDAERQARAAAQATEGGQALRAGALAALASVLLARGISEEALHVAREASSILDQVGVIEDGELRVRLVLVEALHANGHLDEARAALARAHDRVLDRARTIEDTALRESFLGRVPENVRIIDLAREWKC